MMEDLTGIQLLNTLKTKPFVILTTAYDNYAIQGFELDVVDYMLKPISFERFVKGVTKVYERMYPNGSTSDKQDNRLSDNSQLFFFVKTENRIEKINFSDILYFEGMGDYWRIVTLQRRIMSLISAKNIEEMLPENRFCRVHKSFFVAYDKIEAIERNRIRIKDMYIPIGETYRKIFFDTIERKKIS
jgi:DNA-binding LytR/AlgR family response regulator